MLKKSIRTLQISILSKSSWIVNNSRLVLLGIGVFLSVLSIFNLNSNQSIDSTNEQVIIQTQAEFENQETSIIGRLRQLLSRVGNPRLQAITLLSTNEIASNELETFSLESCRVKPVNIQAGSSDNVFLTAQLELPLWNWLNFPSNEGVGASNIPTPIAVTNEQSNLNFNYVKPYSLDSFISDSLGNELNIPIWGNGLTSISDLRMELDPCINGNILGSDCDRVASRLNYTPQDIYPDLAQFQLENNDEDFTSFENNLLLSELEAPAIPSTSQLELNQKNLVRTDIFRAVEDNICEQQGLDYLYVGGNQLTIEEDGQTSYAPNSDSYTSPEFILQDPNDLGARLDVAEDYQSLKLTNIDVSQIEELSIPGLASALRDAYLLQQERGLNTQLALDPNGKVIHNNNAGIQATLKLREYEYSTSNEALVELRALFERAQRSSQDNNGSQSNTNDASLFSYEPNYIQTGSRQPVGIYEYEVYLPWVAQIRQIYARQAKLLNDSPTSNDFESAQVLVTERVECGFNRISAGIDQYLNDQQSLNDKCGFEDEIIKQRVQADPNFEQPEVATLSGLEKVEFYVDYLQTWLISDISLLNCSEVDNYISQADILREQIVELQKLGQLLPTKVDVIAALERLTEVTTKVDCWDPTGTREDPLTQYLCEESLLEGTVCDDYTVTARGFEEDGDGREIETPQFADPVCEEVYGESAGEQPDTTPISNNGLVRPIEGPWNITVDRTETRWGVRADHPGIDLAIPTGTPLFAIADGTCIFARTTDATSHSENALWNSPRGGFGLTVMLEHTNPTGENFYSVYAHLSRVNCNEGDRIVAGETIGFSGESGNSTGPHLHFEVRKTDDYVDYDFDMNFLGRCDASYCDPECLDRPETCRFSAGVSREVVPQAQCIVAESNFVQPTSTATDNQLYLQIIRELGYTPEVIAENRNLRNIFGPDYADIVGVMANTIDQEGSISITSILGAEYPDNILGIVKRVSEFTNVPEEKLYAHLCIENYGPYINECDLVEFGELTGNIDYVRNSQYNSAGCFGPSQFCPGTIQAYFHPNGNYYNSVYNCVTDGLGVQIENGEIINPGYLGNSLCGMAELLKFRYTFARGESLWVDTTCRNINISELEYYPQSREDFIEPASAVRLMQGCGYLAASRSYMGYIYNDMDYLISAIKTSDTASPESFIVQYRDTIRPMYLAQFDNI